MIDIAQLITLLQQHAQREVQVPYQLGSRRAPVDVGETIAAAQKAAAHFARAAAVGATAAERSQGDAEDRARP